MSEPPSNRNLHIKGSADGSVVIVGNGNTVENSSLTGEPNPFGVPYQRNRYFTGREAVLTQLHQQLTQSTATAITQVQAISGLGGIGKTQTAVEYAYRYYYDERVYDTVFWVKADTEINLATDFAEIANQLALPIAQLTQAEKLPAVKAWLTTHHNWLLIFDNADNPDWLTGFMPTNPQGKVLVTSRTSEFDQLGIQKPLALDVLSNDEAVVLLLERTGYEATEGNIAAATELNQELDGLPLALEQASAFIVRRKIAFSIYLKTYRRKGLSQLEKEKAKTGQYPSTVLKTWAINFEAVTAENPAAAALLEMSAFLAPDKIPYQLLTAGSAYLGQVLSSYLLPEDSDDSDEQMLALGELLALLGQYSLVRWEPESLVYSVHRLVQAVIRDGMSPSIANSWVHKLVSAIAYAYPGHEFEHWKVCEQLLPHWLKLGQQAQQIGYEAVDLGTLLGQSGYYLKEQSRYAEAEPLLRQSLNIIQRTINEKHPHVATSMHNLGTVHQGLGHYREAELLYQKALDLRQNSLEKNHPNIATSLSSLGTLYQDQGRHSEAETLLEKSLKLRKSIFGEPHPDVATSLDNLGSLYERQGRYSEAEPLLTQSLALRRTIFGEQHPHVAASLHNLANLYERQGLYDEAERSYKQSLSLKQELFGDTHPILYATLNNLALLSEQLGRYSDAESLYKESLKLMQSAGGESHPNIATSLNNLGLLCGRQGRYDEAESLHKKSLLLFRQTLGETHPDVASNLNNLGILYSKQGKYAKAEKLFKQALDLREQSLGETHPDVATTLNNLAMINYERRKYAEAESLQKRSLFLRRKNLGKAHPDVATNLHNLALIYEKGKRYEKAEPLYKEALRITQQIREETHPDVATSYNNLAMFYLNQGLYAKSEPLLKKALAIGERGLGASHLSVETIRNNLKLLKKKKKKKKKKGFANL